VISAPTLAMPLLVPRPNALVAVGYTWVHLQTRNMNL
jgi:hypothetical protein